jgi:hypothetical protein
MVGCGDFWKGWLCGGKVSASTENQALNELVFFFREGLKRQLGG